MYINSYLSQEVLQNRNFFFFFLSFLRVLEVGTVLVATGATTGAVEPSGVLYGVASEPGRMAPEPEVSMVEPGIMVEPPIMVEPDGIRVVEPDVREEP